MVQYKNLLSDTICSPITAPGYSGVGVIRISGKRALEITRKHTKIKKENIPSHSSHLTEIFCVEGRVIDQVLVTYFEENRSFTGDETVEVSCHGNPLIINAIINIFLAEGCRVAEKGEFSFRAYYNGKIDLVQAESIHQLVMTNNINGSESFLAQLRGKLSVEFQGVEQNLILALSHLEASIDFVEQDIDVANYGVVKKIIIEILKDTQKLIDSYSVGKSLRESYKVLLLGKTNVGKSSLFNKFVEQDRAIVTEVAGTTRDIVTSQKFLGHSSVEFIDSAGLRETADEIEKLGIQKSLEQVEQADLILYLVDITNPEGSTVDRTLPRNKIRVVFNKIDLLSSENEIKSASDSFFKTSALEIEEERVCFVSSVSSQGLDELISQIESSIVKQQNHQEEGLVTQARHYNHLCELSRFLEEGLKLIAQNISPDILSQELQFALSEIHQLLGKEYNDEVLDKIFSQFCIGK